VIKGYEQIRGIDFDETYAPVSKLITLRYLLSFAVQNNYKNDHLDVVTSFLNPEIDIKVYMQLPEDIEWLESTAMLAVIAIAFYTLTKRYTAYGKHHVMGLDGLSWQRTGNRAERTAHTASKEIEERSRVRIGGSKKEVALL
jgi:hypothetical protein